MIFCVEDDPNIRELEVYTLQSVGFKLDSIGGIDVFKERLAMLCEGLIEKYLW